MVAGLSLAAGGDASNYILTPLALTASITAVPPPPPPPPPPVVVPPVVVPPVVVPPVVQPPVVVQQSGDPQAAIALLIQEASRVAAGSPDTRSPDTSPEPTRHSGLVLVDVSDVPTSEQGKSRLSAKGFVNVFVVDGGINMGNNDAKSPQR